MCLRNRIKNIRLALGKKQKEIADDLGIAKGTYSNVESGSGSLSANLLFKYRNVFNVNINWLITGEGEMFTKKMNFYFNENKLAEDLNEIRRRLSELELRLKENNIT